MDADGAHCRLITDAVHASDLRVLLRGGPSNLTSRFRITLWLTAVMPTFFPARTRSTTKLEDRLARICAVSKALTPHLPVERSRDQEAQWILAQILEWHRREDKVDWWEYFRLNEMAEDELLDERAGIAGLVFERRLETTKRGVVVDRYPFAPGD